MARSLLVAFLLALSAQWASAMEMGPGSSMPMPMPNSTTSTEPCVNMPSMANCASYQYPAGNATADLVSLCTAMPFMTGCSIGNICGTTTASANALRSNGYCEPMSLLADTCVSDTGMSRMVGCRNYNSMCNMTTSVVAACAANKPIPNLPTTMQVSVCRAVC
jgi:hypothetical protein